MNGFLYTLLGDLLDEPIPTYDQIFGLNDPRDQMRHGFDNPNETSLPFIVNVVNPDKESPNGAVCGLCRSAECMNCPLPVRHDLTLREYLTRICDKTNFYNNASLYRGFKPPGQTQQD